MPDPLDKVAAAAPVGSADAGSPTGSDGTNQDQSVGAGGSAQTPDFEAQFTALNESMDKLRKETTNQRSIHDRQMARMRAEMTPPAPPPTYVQAGQAAPDENAFASQINAKFASSDQARADLEYQTAINTFKVDNAGWGDDWDEMQKILGDNEQVVNVAVYRQDGSVDYGKTLSYTRNMVQNVKYGAARAKADAERATLEAGRASRQAQAVISGSAGYAIPQGFTEADVSKMSPEEMVKKGVFPTSTEAPTVYD